jgi:hypothetical protein
MAYESQLTSVAEVIDAFGGPKAMCKLFGGGPSRFSNYKANGRFPNAMRMPIYVEAARRGLRIAPELVGMPPEIAELIQTPNAGGPNEALAQDQARDSRESTGNAGNAAGPITTGGSDRAA